MRESGGKECSYYFSGKLRSYDPGAETEDIHVIIFYALAGGKRIVTD